MIHDIIAEVRFYHTEDEGIKGVYDRDFYSCPIQFKGHENEPMHDCRVDTKEFRPVMPGDTIVTGIKFLNFDAVKKYIKIGDIFLLWNSRFIGEGKVEKIFIAKQA